MDLAAVHAAPGVVAVFTAADIPGENNVGPVAHDEPLLAQDEILYPGQALFLVAATSAEAARRAARKAVFDLEPLPALVSIADADAAQSLIEATQRMARGDAAAAPRRRAAPIQRHAGNWRAGAFLPRGPGRDRDAGRGRARCMSCRRPSIRARGSISSPTCSGSIMPT
jgi:xanthine dehydrogenase molybdopterin-binding subunit B